MSKYLNTAPMVDRGTDLIITVEQLHRPAAIRRIKTRMIEPRQMSLRSNAPPAPASTHCESGRRGGATVTAAAAAVHRAVPRVT